jgi:glycosyltransferase involved in cell wall biosynthesis
MVVVLIPAYQPDEALVKLVKQLKSENFSCLVVDDGSGEAYAKIFDQIKDLAAVIHAPKNGGKGSALKLGMSKIKELYPECTHFITADADGQHKVSDIIRVKEALEKGAVMVLTERSFQGEIPARSMVGNILSRWVYCILTGHYLSDNQSGLRGFKVSEIDWLTLVSGEKYDYEINMLYYADCQHIPIDLIDVDSVYIDGNKSSHFNPVRDTLRIYRRLFTSAAGSIIAGLITFIAAIVVTFTYGYNYCLITVPVIGAAAFFINLGVDALKFQKIHYRDGGRTLLYAAFRFTYYTFATALVGILLPQIPLCVALFFFVLIAVPVRFYLYQFAFSRIFFKGSLNSKKK